MEEYKNFMNDVYDLFCVTNTIDATTISSKKPEKRALYLGRKIASQQKTRTEKNNRSNLGFVKGTSRKMTKKLKTK